MQIGSVILNIRFGHIEETNMKVFGFWISFIHMGGGHGVIEKTLLVGDILQIL